MLFWFSVLFIHLLPKYVSLRYDLRTSKSNYYIWSSSSFPTDGSLFLDPVFNNWNCACLKLETSSYQKWRNHQSWISSPELFLNPSLNLHPWYLSTNSGQNCWYSGHLWSSSTSRYLTCLVCFYIFSNLLGSLYLAILRFEPIETILHAVSQEPSKQSIWPALTYVFSVISIIIL